MRDPAVRTPRNAAEIEALAKKESLLYPILDPRRNPGRFRRQSRARRDRHPAARRVINNAGSLSPELD